MPKDNMHTESNFSSVFAPGPPGGFTNIFPKSKNPWDHSNKSVSPWNACSYLPWWPPVSWLPAFGRAGAWRSALGPGARNVSPSPKVFPAWNSSSGGGIGSSELRWGRCSSYPWGSWEKKRHTVRREQGSDQNIPGVLLQEELNPTRIFLWLRSSEQKIPRKRANVRNSWQGTDGE